MVTILKRCLAATCMGLLWINPLIGAVPADPEHRVVGQVWMQVPKASESGSAWHAFHAITPKHQSVALLKVQLSPSEREALLARFKQHQQHQAAVSMNHQAHDANHASSAIGARRRHQLGMNGVPVLNQGMHGTCVTFATAAAVDALYGLHGEAAMSPLCQLQLSRTVRGEPGAWEGYFGAWALEDLIAHGFITQQYQHTAGCGGLKAYPHDVEDDLGAAMPATVFDQNSDHRFTAANRKTLMFDPVMSPKGHQHLEDVKRELRAGHRVMMATLIDLGFNAVGQHHGHPLDTWVLTHQIEQDWLYELANQDDVDALRQFGGHEVVITGYDDHACTDQRIEGRKRCGLLTIRNSWSAAAGDQGDYYMTYDYFKLFVRELHALKPY